MTTRRARYPQPAAASIVLAEVAARNFCEHDGIAARCPSCRAATEPPVDQDSPEPPAPRPPRRRATRLRKPRKPEEDRAPGQLW
jgi:hypothetical protein